MNPWQQIQSDEYEAHMSAPDVLQLQVLNEIFRKVIDQFNPDSIFIPGCTTGNGFEHLIDRQNKIILGVDINYKYLAECHAWFAEDLPSLNLICADLNDLEIQHPYFDLIHTALIFEYVDVQKVLSKLSNWLNPGGIISVVLQLQTDSSDPVSETPYESIKKLSSIIKLVDEREFVDLAEGSGLKEIYSSQINLQKGKKFYVGYFKKMEIFRIVP
jgi:SAM-dependent methyltransferase